MSGYQCLVVQQPWAWAILTGAKEIENRSWSTEYRGPLIIQAGAAKTEVNRLMNASTPPLPDLPFAYGSLIGAVDLVDVVPLSEELENNPWAQGPYCWKLSNSRRFQSPIPAKGKLKLFALDASISSQVREAIESASCDGPNDASRAWLDRLTTVEVKGDRQDALFTSYMDLEDFDSLMRLAQRSVAANANSEAFTNLAIAQTYGDGLEAALTNAARAIELDPLGARAYTVRSHIYHGLGKRDLAARDRREWERLEKLHPPTSTKSSN